MIDPDEDWGLPLGGPHTAAAPLQVPLGTDLEGLRGVIRRVWGFDELRPLQAEAMQAALEGRDALVVLATGGGKSLCYQAPALAREGLTAVVSPLISLMKDQIDALRGNGVPAAMLTSAQDGAEKREVFARLQARELKLLFVAPERLLMPGFFDELCALGLSALVIDEAHCISHWGHDFRPEYRRIGALRAQAPQLPVQAFTATATPRVQGDICAELGLRDAAVLVGDCDRPNLTYRFQPRSDALAQTLAVVRRHPDEAGIVYCLRRKDTESLARDLAAAGVTCLPYHAGLSAQVRTHNQERFLREEISVIVATVAFGMGIDRSDVRFVVHAALPKGLEQYSQESGRAGRDGLPAECVLLYSGSDFHGWRSLMERPAEDGTQPSAGDLEGQLERLGRMWSFASGAQCRHRVLAEHFGGSLQPQPEGGCGACDVCLGELVTEPESQLLAQKILSCVVRCEQRYGAAHVTDVLRGRDNERVRRSGHASLSTFGLMAEHSAREIRHWIDQLIGLEHLRAAAGTYPTLALTPSGVQVMKGAREVALFALPVTSRSTRSGRGAAALAELAREEGAPAADEALFERLRALRRRLAAERAVPPYLIFGDRTLALLASLRPRTPQELLGIKGIGEKKAQDLGAAVLELLREHERESSPTTG